MTKSIIFDILAIDSASPTFSKVGMAAGTMSTKVKTAGAYASKGFLVAGVAAAALGIHAVKMAGDFDAAIVRLETTAGESHAALAQVSNGLLDMAGKVGYSAEALAKGMYTVESAGYHGAAGLKVMEAAAKGARVEGADLTVVTDAVSSLLVDYHLKADQAARVTNILTAAVGHGKTTFEGMAGALPNVAAAGASAKISMAELSSAIATMTMHGTDASKAGTYLRQVIGQLEAPSAKARTVMKGLGLDANQLGLTLSSGSGHGLADAIKMVDDAITTHLSPSGLVAIKAFRDSKNATSDYKKVLADLPPTLTTSFGALTNMVGGVKSLQGFLQLGGENLKTYKNNVKAVREQVRSGGKDVEGFGQQQQTLNGKLNDAQGAASGLAVKVGQDLTPAAKGAATVFARLATTLSAHDQAVAHTVMALSALAGVLIVAKTASMAAAVATALLGGAEVTLALRMAATALVTGDLTGAMAAMSMAMDANPVGLVVIAIAALAAGLVYAWKNSSTFRSVVISSFHAVEAGAKFMWNNVLAPVFSFWAKAMGVNMLIYAKLFEVMGKVPGFGWVGKLGDKLETAAHKAMDLNLQITNLPPTKTVTVRVNYVQTHVGRVPIFKGQAALPAGTPGGRIAGGRGSEAAPHGPGETFWHTGHSLGAAFTDGIAGGIKGGKSSIGKAIDKVTAFIGAQTDKLQSLLSARAGIVQSFLGMTSSTFSQDFSSNEGGTSVQAMLAYQQDQLSKALQVQADVAKAVSMGLSKALVTQLANSGSTGIANLHALATGPQSAITAMNSLDAQTTAALSKAGMTAGNDLYGSQITAAQRDKNTAIEIRDQLEAWRKQHDKNTIIELHVGANVVRASLLELKRRGGGKPLGIS